MNLDDQTKTWLESIDHHSCFCELFEHLCCPSHCEEMDSILAAFTEKKEKLEAETAPIKAALDSLNSLLAQLPAESERSEQFKNTTLPMLISAQAERKLRYEALVAQMTALNSLHNKYLTRKCHLDDVKCRTEELKA